MTDTLREAYDQVPYEGKPRYEMHPDCLATVATLMGMTPPPVATCRVLELGCGTGGHLIPLAQALPHARLVGIDLSPRQIEIGREVIRAAGLTNIELHARSILELQEDFGEFDYITCHGVYSWVPPHVQVKILSICRRNLAANGVAYVSYNTLPGWHLRAAVRDMLNYHVGRAGDPPQRVQAARGFLKFLNEGILEPDSAFGQLLRDEAKLLADQPDYYVFHEHLEDENRPLYFHQFVERAAAHGLQFLGEAWDHGTLARFPQPVQEVLRQISGDVVQLEQYQDFLRHRTFRQTLLCQDQTKLTRNVNPEVVFRLQVSALARPTAPNPEVPSTAAVEFRNDRGSTASTNSPLVKAALVALFETWPQAMSFDELWSAVEARLPGLANADAASRDRGRRTLAGALVQFYLSNMAALHVHFPSFTTALSERPQAPALIRLLAARGLPVASLRHAVVQTNALDRWVLQRLDGSRDRSALARELADAVGRGDIELVRPENRSPNDDPHALAGRAVDECLQRLARMAVLLA